MSERFDVTVVGGGPGGYVAALRAAQLGLKTAIVERDKSFGGTCLLRGCIPSKAMLHDAALWSELRRSNLVKGELTFDWKAVMDHKDRAITVNSKGVEYLLKNAKVTILKGEAAIPEAGRVEVKGTDGKPSTIRSGAIIVATGSAPRTLPGIAIDEEQILTSNGAFGIPSVPKRFAVLGSGAIGVEFATVFGSFGAEVTVLELLPRVVPNEDEEVSAEMERYLKKQGMKVHTRTTVTRAEVRDKVVHIEARSEDGETQLIEVDRFLVAVGRRPVTEGVGLESLGVKMERGFVLVDANQRTSVAGVYAVGDIVPGPQLAHKAMAEGIVAAETIAGAPTVPVNPRLIPGATYSEPEIGSVGLTEARARAEGHELKIGKFPFTANARAKIEHMGVGFVKIVADAKYDEILGVHIIGPHATELIAEAAAVMRLEGTSEELARTIHAHPTVSEAVGEAAHAVLGHAIHM